MNRAIQQFTPGSSWITAGLLTLFVVSFTLLAEAHRPDTSTTGITGFETSFHFMDRVQHATDDEKSTTLLRFH